MSDDRNIQLPPNLRAAAVRQRGLPKSAELSGAALLLTIVAIGMQHVSNGMADLCHLTGSAWESCADISANADPSNLAGGLRLAPSAGNLLLCFFLVWLVAGVAVAVQGGWTWRWQAIRPDATRLQPRSPFQSETLGRSLVSFLISPLKIVIVLATAGIWLWHAGPQILFLAANNAATRESNLITLLMSGLLVVTTPCLVVGLIDYTARVILFRRSLRISTQEWRDKLRALEGNPETRRIQRENRQSNWQSSA